MQYEIGFLMGQILKRNFLMPPKISVCIATIRPKLLGRPSSLQ